MTDTVNVETGDTQESQTAIQADLPLEPAGDDGFSAAFDATLSGEPVPQVEAKVEESPQPEEVKEAEPPPPTVEELMAQMKSEFYTELGKVRDTAAGRVGELNQRVQQMLAQQKSSGGSGLQLSKEKLKRLSGEFPEMAEMIAEDLNEALASVGGQPQQFDQSQFDARLKEEVGSIHVSMTKDMERFKLGIVQPDWADVIGLPDENNVIPDTEFRRWLKTKPLEFQDRVASSWVATEIAGAINQFREETAKSQPNTDLANQQAQQRKKRLEDAVTPTHARQAAPQPSVEDDFEAGFRAVRG